jgi:hypothetical protein
LVFLAEEHVAANEVWEETKDGQADGLQIPPYNVLTFVLLSPEAACFESAVEYGAPTIAITVAIDIGCLD